MEATALAARAQRPAGDRHQPADVPPLGLERQTPESAPSLAMDVIVGKAVRTQTPVFADEMTHLIFRPYWNVRRA